MNELIQTFNFGIKDNGDVYFCLTDVATILDISNANASRFSLDENGVHKMYTPTKAGLHKMYISYKRGWKNPYPYTSWY